MPTTPFPTQLADREGIKKKKKKSQPGAGASLSVKGLD